MAHFDLPLRTRKDFARAAQLRSLALSRAPRSVLPPSFDEPYLPSPRRRLDRPPAGMGMPQSPFFPYPEPIHDFSQPTYRPASYPRREEHSSSNGTRIPFSKAARTLYYALGYAARQAERLERDFVLDTQYLPYADEHTRAHLWTLKVSYKGWQDGDSDVPPPDDKNEYFAPRAIRLLEAIEDMRDAEPPSRDLWAETQRGGARYGGGGDGMEDVRLATKKLAVGLGAIKELLEGIKVDKGRCAVLVRELRGAEEVLNGIRDVWDHGKSSGGRGGYGSAVNTARAKIPVAFEDEWGDYRGE